MSSFAEREKTLNPTPLLCQSRQKAQEGQDGIARGRAHGSRLGTLLHIHLQLQGNKLLLTRLELLLMDQRERQAWEPRWDPAGMEIIPDGGDRQMEAQNGL